jgi:hypothetical protein
LAVVVGRSLVLSQKSGLRRTNHGSAEEDWQNCEQHRPTTKGAMHGNIPQSIELKVGSLG